MNFGVASDPLYCDADANIKEVIFDKSTVTLQVPLSLWINELHPCVCMRRRHLPVVHIFVVHAGCYWRSLAELDLSRSGGLLSVYLSST